MDIKKTGFWVSLSEGKNLPHEPPEVVVSFWWNTDLRDERVFRFMASRGICEESQARDLWSEVDSWIKNKRPVSETEHPVVALLPTVDHPAHYGGADNPYEAIKVIEAWSLGFCLGNAVKYICRAGKKLSSTSLEDLEKARWYLSREIERLSSTTVTSNSSRPGDQKSGS